jgi:glycine/D-amino acid oxidase-like deaminating enzyme
MTNSVARRRVLSGAGALLCAGTLPRCAARFAGGEMSAPKLELAPLDSSSGLVSRITVCTRPFRAQGPRLDVEQIAGKTIVHNYGHGGSGWSLSWGSGEIAAGKAMATGERDIAVIGCGALGMTSALLLQRAGARVTIYARELPPNVRSSLATGLFTPDSRICQAEYATPEFKNLWQGMCRKSYQTYSTLLGLPGNPVEFIDNYEIADLARSRQLAYDPVEARPDFAELQSELTPDLLPRGTIYSPGQHPFGNRSVRRTSSLMFNITEYSRYLLSQFQSNGGRIVVREFHSPNEFGALPEKTLINCTGYGARALLGDNSVIPVRGQLARMMPQPRVHYALLYRATLFLARRDEFVFQHFTGEAQGFNDESSDPDHSEAETAVRTIGQLFAAAA